MIFKTKGIVLRTVKYGETSLVVSIYTELFGLQSYMVNGVRTFTKRGPGKANLFQPAAILDLVIYHNELKNLQRIKEFKWSYLYQHILTDVRRNTVAQFMVELLQKTIKQPEPNASLFNFIEDSFLHLDKAKDTVMANFALFFALHLTSFLGFSLSDKFSAFNNILDLQEGSFVHERPLHPHFLVGQYSFITSQLLQVNQPLELDQIKLNHEFRRNLLLAYQGFYSLHVEDFGIMKTLPILQTLLA
ncbi:MAG: DNA repair protein RecO [Chitinophagaceae bacterium]